MAKKEKTEGLVPVFLIKDADKYKDDVQVIINGKTYLIQRGKAVYVPKAVKEVLEAQQRQDMAAADYIEKQVAAYEATLTDKQ